MVGKNLEIAKLLRSIAAALTLKRGNLFQIRAYEAAADNIEHSTTEIKDLWEESKLDQVPGLGANLQTYLDEYFKTGRIKHFESIMRGFNPVIFQLLDIPGVGPKTASELAKLGVESKGDLKKKLASGQLVEKGFSAKKAENLTSALGADISGERMLLPYAAQLAEKISEYMKKCPGIVTVEPLGSLRRQVVTIGDIDFAASSKNPERVIEYFVKMPGVVEVVSQGENKATVRLTSGKQIDLLVGEPQSYGALLQHFTGSKAHNIALRTYAEKKDLSISEYGVKDKNGKVLHTKTEDELYKLLGMQTPPPEIRENTGEIEAAFKHKLPDLIKYSDVKGDFHLHSNFPIKPSHDAGVDSIEDIVNQAVKLEYQYVGISDHSPAFTTHSASEIVKLIDLRTKSIQKIKQSKKSIHILNGLEIDILGDGSLSVPDDALKTLDYVIAGIHSGHRGAKEQITKRIIKALESPYVTILAHPTGRLLNQRGSYDADWEAIFKICVKNNKLLEINAYPNRLDLRDDLVREALRYGCKFIINTDSHEISQMKNMPYGVSVAKRGWVAKIDIVNTWDWNNLMKWFKI